MPWLIEDHFSEKPTNTVMTELNLDAHGTNTIELMRLFEILILARHGNAEKLPGGKDADRQLSEKGKQQAEKLGAALEGYHFDVIVSSPLTRASDTAMIATGRPGEFREIVHLNELAPDTDDKNCPLNIMFEKLMYSPLAKYYEHELADHLKTWGRVALQAIVDHIRSLGLKDRARVFVGGHAVCQNAVAWALAEILERDGVVSHGELTCLAMDTMLGEAQAIEVNFLEDSIQCRHITP